jgi:hypothetical protein
MQILTPRVCDKNFTDIFKILSHKFVDLSIIINFYLIFKGLNIDYFGLLFLSFWFILTLWGMGFGDVLGYLWFLCFYIVS